MASSSKNPIILIGTPLGNVKVEIFEHEAPITSKNFLRYVDGKLYDGTSFLRTVKLENQLDSEIKIELISGGVVSREKGYPLLEHETTQVTGLKHVNGTISMSRGKPGSATSRFFVCVGDQPELNYGGRRNPDGQGFAAFGKVVEGMDVIRMIHKQPFEGQMLKPPIEISSIHRIN